MAPTDAVPFLVRLYPSSWRARYGAEFADLLAARSPSFRDRVDIVLGAIDARINPQVGHADDDEIRLPAEPSIRVLLVTAGGLLTAWALIGVSLVRPWNSGEWPYEPALSTVAWVVGMLGALGVGAALFLLAGRHSEAIGSSGSLGGLGAGLGLVLASLGGGVAALALLGIGTASLAWALRGRMLGAATAVTLAGMTALLIGAYVAFAAGGGQDVRILWGIVAYGPAWILVGVNLRTPSAQLVRA